MNDYDSSDIRKTIADLEHKAALAQKFLDTEFGRYYIKSLDDLITDYTERGENLQEAAALRCHDAAKGARAAKDILFFAIKQTEEGGLIETLRDQLRRTKGSQVDQ